MRVFAFFGLEHIKIGMKKVSGKEKHYLPDGFFMPIFSKLNKI